MVDIKTIINFSFNKKLIILIIILFVFSSQIIYPANNSSNNKITINSPEWITAGEQAKIKITCNDEPVENAIVIINERKKRTNKNGNVLLKFHEEGDFEISAFKDGYKAKADTFFKSDCTNFEDWYTKYWLNENGEAISLKYLNGKNYININTYTQKKGKSWLRPRIRGKNNNFQVWDDYLLKFRYKILKQNGGFHISIRENPRGRYWLALHKNGYLQMNKTYPKRNYFDRDNIKEQELILDNKVEIEDDIWHTMKIKAVNNNISVFLDNKKALSFTDNAVENTKRPFLEGIFSFETYKNIDVLIDNVEVKEILENTDIAKKNIRVYPKGNNNISIRGAKDKGYPYLRFSDVKNLGGNWVKRIKTFGINGDNYKIDSMEERKIIEDYIDRARYRGLNIYYAPFLRWEAGVVGNKNIPQEKTDQFLDDITQIILEEAKFAREKKVEMFAPIINLEEFVPYKIADEYYKKIVPEIREVYNGEIIMGKLSMQTLKEYEFDFSSYDYITITCGPQNSYDEYEEKLNEMVRLSKKLSKKYTNKKVIVPFFGATADSAFVKKELNSGKSIEYIKSKIYKIFFETTQDHIDGYFLDCQWWEKENAKLYTILENMNKDIYTHNESWFFGYQNNEVAKKIKSFYSSN